MTGGELTDDEIADFIDGRLDDRRRVEVERWLHRHPDRASDVARQRELDRALKDLGAEILAEPIPERLRRILDRRQPGREGADGTDPSAMMASAFTWRRPLGGLALVLAGAVAGWLAHATLEPEMAPADPKSAPLDVLLADATYAYLFYADEQPHGIEFPPERFDGFDEASHLIYDRPVLPPDLRPVGYEFRGARVAPTGPQSSTFFFFEGEDGDEVAVLLWRRSDDSPAEPGFRVINDVEARVWSLDDLGFAILARDGGEESLRDLSDHVIAFYNGAGAAPSR